MTLKEGFIGDNQTFMLRGGRETAARCVFLSRRINQNEICFVIDGSFSRVFDQLLLHRCQTSDNYIFYNRFALSFLSACRSNENWHCFDNQTSELDTFFVLCL